MSKFVNEQASTRPKDLPESPVRLPVNIVEDVKRKTLKAYSGFSNERYKSLKKTIERALELPDQEDN